MSRVAPYTREFTDLECTGGTAVVHTLKYPYRGTLKAANIIVTNDGGSGEGGIVELYSKLVDDASPNKLYLIHTFELSSNEFHDGAIDVDYENREGTPTQGVRQLYARALLTGAGAKLLSIALTVEQPQH